MRAVNSMGRTGAVAGGIVTLALWCSLVGEAVAQSDAPIFSGPQPGESLPEFPARLVLGEEAGKTRDLVGETTPTHPHRLLIVVHELTRPSVRYARVLGEYGQSRREDGLRTGLVFLGADATELAQRVRRAAHALPDGIPVAISEEGAEGPGSYGFNRKVTLTVLLASDGRVEFNQALIDPSLPVELPKALRAICRLVGGDPPNVEQLLGQRAGMRRGEAARGAMRKGKRPTGFDQVEPLLRRLIRADAEPAEVNRIAERIDALLKKFPAAGKRVKEIATKVHDKYGSERAQHHLRRWAELDQ